MPFEGEVMETVGGTISPWEGVGVGVIELEGVGVGETLGVGVISI
jgi:hypothetical protein